MQAQQAWYKAPYEVDEVDEQDVLEKKEYAIHMVQDTAASADDSIFEPLGFRRGRAR